MDWWLANFFLGAIFSLFLPIVPDLFVLFLLLLFSIIFFSFSFCSFFNLGKTSASKVDTTKKSIDKNLRSISGLLFGATWMLFNAYSLQNLWAENHLSKVELATTKHILQGQILTLHASPELVFNGQADNNDIKETIKEAIKKTSKQANGQITKKVDKSLRFNFNVTHIDSHPLNSAITMRFSWKKPNINVQQGQILQLKAKFKPAHGLANLGGFSYQTWLNSKDIIATGYIVNSDINKIITNNVTTRQHLFNSYRKLLPKHELSPLLLALSFGSRADLSSDLWQVLQTTATGHLIAISGLHIGLVASGSYFMFILFIRLLPLKYLSKAYVMQSINIRYFAIAFSLVTAFSYGYLAGFSLPTIRALVMLSLYWLTRLLAIKLSITRWLLLTLFVLTLTSPFSLFTASFWLSVYAVTIIFITLWRFKGYLSQDSASQGVMSQRSKVWCSIKGFMKGLIVIQLSLTLLLLPISAIFFQQISPLSLLANIIAVPWMSFVSIPLCLLSVIIMPISELLSQFLIMLSIESLQGIWLYLTYLSRQPWSIVELSKFNVLWLIFVGLASFLILFVKSSFSFNSFTFNNKRTLIITLFIVITLTLFSFSKSDVNEMLTNKKVVSDSQNQWQLIVFDVGQGLSVLIKKEDKAILYDTGAAYPSGFNMADAVILPYLQHAGIKQLDKIIISHSDNDHAGGLATLQQAIKVGELIYNIKLKGNYKEGEKERKSNNVLCKQGDNFKWQSLNFTVLWPKVALGKDNDDSCVLLVSDGQNKILLTGDISKKVEAKLLRQYPQLTVDLLMVPHHGSKTSSSLRFLQQLSPKLAIVSAGFINRWRMPVTDVVQAYQAENIQLLNTAKTGQIIINISNKGMSQLTYRDDLWPFWFAHSL